MKIIEKNVQSKEQEAVVLQYVTMSRDFQEIKEFCRKRGSNVVVYAQDRGMLQLPVSEVLYFEAVGDLVFAYTRKNVYEVKQRLYQLEEKYASDSIVRASKSVLVNIFRIVSVRTALNGRLYAKMENDEEVMVTRSYSKEISRMILEDRKI